jgi:hypothetical protein
MDASTSTHLSRIIVWGIWLASAASAVLIALTYGVNVPYSDDCSCVRELSGVSAVTPKWLWSQVNDHRVPLPKLAFLSLARLTHLNYRALMLLNVSLLALSTAALLVALRICRGQTLASDAIVPLLVLSPNTAEVFVTVYDLPQVMCTSFLLLYLACMFVLAGDRRCHWGAVPGAVAAIVCLPLVGAHGVTVAGTLAVTTLALAARHVLKRPPHRAAWLLLAFASSASLAIAAACVLTFTKPAHHPPLANPLTATWFALHFLAGSLSTSPELRAATLPLVIGIQVIASVALLHTLRSRPTVAPWLVSIGAVAVAVVLLAYVTGMGRAGFGLYHAMVGRNALLATPWAITCYALISMVSVNRTSMSVARWAFVAITFLLLAPNATQGLGFAHGRHATLAPVFHAIKSGEPVAQIADKYSSSVCRGGDRFYQALLALSHTHNGPFAR